MSQKKEQVDDKCLDIVQRLTSLLAKVMYYVHLSLLNYLGDNAILGLKQL